MVYGLWSMSLHSNAHIEFIVWLGPLTKWIFKMFAVTFKQRGEQTSTAIHNSCNVIRKLQSVGRRCCCVRVSVNAVMADDDEEIHVPARIAVLRPVSQHQ